MSLSFPQQLYEAAKLYPNSCTAHAQFRAGNDFTALRIQAPEIMMQFVGDVQFGRDPKGRLFYRSNAEWPTACHTIYTIFHYRTTITCVVVRVDFYVPGRSDEVVPYARFLASVEESQLPPMVPGLGQGKWSNLKMVTSHAEVTRRENDSTIYLESDSIQKQAYFTSGAQTEFTQSGVLLFRLLAQLKDKPDGERDCVADYTPDRIVFHLEKRPGKVVALFLPDTPVKNIADTPVKNIGGPTYHKVTWIDTQPPDDFAKAFFNMEA